MEGCDSGKSKLRKKRKGREEKNTQGTEGGRKGEGTVITEVKRVDGSDKTLYPPAAECKRQEENVGTRRSAGRHKWAKPGRIHVT